VLPYLLPLVFHFSLYILLIKSAHHNQKEKSYGDEYEAMEITGRLRVLGDGEPLLCKNRIPRFSISFITPEAPLIILFIYWLFWLLKPKALEKDIDMWVTQELLSSGKIMATMIEITKHYHLPSSPHQNSIRKLYLSSNSSTHTNAY